MRRGSADGPPYGHDDREGRPPRGPPRRRLGRIHRRLVAVKSGLLRRCSWMTSRPVALRHAVRVAASVDYKVKSTLHAQAKADHDLQAGLYLAGRWLEGDPHARVLVRADRQARRPAQADERAPDHHAPHPLGSCARCSRGSRRPPARSMRTTSASGPTSRGGSPTPRAGSARRATAPTTPYARAAAGCSAHSSRRGTRRSPRIREPTIQTARLPQFVRPGSERQIAAGAADR